MELDEPCEILVEKRCRRCEQWKNMDTEFRPGNHVCRRCRNDMVKTWTSNNALRREIIRNKARRNGYIQRMAKRQKLQQNNGDVESPVEHIVGTVEHPAPQTERGDEQVAGV